MTKRRLRVSGRGFGSHSGEVVRERKRPTGEVRPIISKQKNGKMKPKQFHEDETFGPDFEGARRAGVAAFVLVLVLAIISISMCAATI